MIKSLLARAPRRDESGGGKNFEMLRDRRGRDFASAREFGDIALVVNDQPHNFQTARLGDCVQQFVSHAEHISIN